MLKKELQLDERKGVRSYIKKEWELGPQNKSMKQTFLLVSWWSFKDPIGLNERNSLSLGAKMLELEEVVYGIFTNFTGCFFP